MCCEAVDAEALWKRRPTKPMSGKFPYYFLRGLPTHENAPLLCLSKCTHTHKKETIPGLTSRTS